MSRLTERLNGRVLAIVLALLLAAIATIALADYIRGERDDAVDNLRLTTVYKTLFDIPAGTEVDFAVRQGAFVTTRVPTDTLPPNPVTNLDDIRGLVVVQPMLTGDLLQGARFGTAVAQADAFEVPEGFVAISVDVSVTAGVANFLDRGDRITILSHLESSAADETGQVTTGATTRILLQDVEILAIGRRVSANDGADGSQNVTRNDEQVTLTLALSPADAEKLVFAQFEANLHIALQPELAGDFQPAVTTGRNAGNLFGR